MTKTVLFLCTGNYYRSRYAQHYFNAQAAEQGLDWRASSRGLQLSAANPGPISAHALARLRLRGIPPQEPIPFPQDTTDDDLTAADLIVAVKESEHRPLLQTRFPDWAERVRYWTIHDLDVSDAAAGLSSLEEAVDALLAELAESAD